MIANHLTDEEKAAIENGAKLDIVLSVEYAGDSVSSADKQATEAALADTEYTLGMYLNIDLFKRIDGQQTKITKINLPISVTIEIPEALRKAHRTYAVVHVHDGEAEILNDTDSDPNTITITTDKFSTFAIVYKDAEAPSSGNPGTGITMPIAVVVLASAVTVTAVMIKKKKMS